MRYGMSFPQNCKINPRPIQRRGVHGISVHVSATKGGVYPTFCLYSAWCKILFISRTIRIKEKLYNNVEHYL